MNAKDLIKQVTTVEGTDLYSLRSIVKVAQQHGGNFNYKSVRARLSNTSALNKIGNDYGVEAKNLCHVFTYALPDFPKLMGLDATKVINQVKFVDGSDLISLRSIVEAIKPYATKANYKHALEVLKKNNMVTVLGSDAGVQHIRLLEGFAAAVSLDNYFGFLSVINKAGEIIKDRDYFVRLHAAKAEKDAKEIQQAVFDRVRFIGPQVTFRHAEYVDGVKNSDDPFACRVRFVDLIEDLRRIDRNIDAEKALKTIKAHKLCYLFAPKDIYDTVHCSTLLFIISVLLRDTEKVKFSSLCKSMALTDAFKMSHYCTEAPNLSLDSDKVVALFDGIVDLIADGFNNKNTSRDEIFATIAARLQEHAAAA